MDRNGKILVGGGAAATLLIDWALGIPVSISQMIHNVLYMAWGVAMYAYFRPFKR